MTANAYRLFLFTLVFAPLAFGTVEPWAYLVMEAAVFAALACFFMTPAAANRKIYRVPGLLPLLLLLGFLLLQAMPLPAALVRLLSPAAAAVREAAGADGWPSLSLNTRATVSEFFRLAAYAGFYILTVQLLSDPKRLKKTTGLVVALGAAIAVEAVIQKVLSPKLVYWFRAVPASATTTGPYVYHNHFAGFMEMLLPVVLVLFFYYRPRFSHRQTLRQQLAALLDQHRTNFHLLLGVAAILITTSIFVSLSRGGIISSSLAVLVLLAVLSRRGRNRQEKGIMALLLVALTVLAVSWFGWDAILARFEAMRNAEGELSDGRFIIWQDSIALIRDFPLVGAGLGTFVHLYPGYRSFSGQNGYVDHAHNDYLELLAGGGIIGFLLAAWFLAAVGVSVWRVYRQRREPYSLYLVPGAAAGMLALLFHAVTDFNFQNGANGLYFFFLAGVTVSAANARFRGRQPTSLATVQVPQRLGTAGALLLLLTTLAYQGGILGAARTFASVSGQVVAAGLPDEEILQLQQAANLAARLDPLAGRYRFARANAAAMLQQPDRASQYYLEALDLSPTESEFLQTAGLYLAGRQETAAAERLLQAAVRWDARNPAPLQRYTGLLLATGRGRETGPLIKKLVDLAPKRFDQVLTMLIAGGLDDDAIRQLLPARVSAAIVFAEYLHQVGNTGLAESVYQDAVLLLPRDPALTPDTIYRLQKYLVSQQRDNEAPAVLLKGIEIFPENTGLRNRAAGLYEKIGIPYRAIEEYQKVLAIDPANQTAARALDRLRKE